jgi:hypothetical protein
MGPQFFDNISQRAAATYRKLLAVFCYVLVEGVTESSQRALYHFFQRLYDCLFEHPAWFGLPESPDDAIVEKDSSEKDKKQEMNRKLEKPRAMIAAGLEFLILAGSQGKLQGEALVVENASALIKQAKVKTAFLEGFSRAGLQVSMTGDTAVLASSDYPEMMPALAALAASCARFDPPNVGRFQFARCDLNAMRGSLPQVEDLYRAFEGQDYDRAIRLHEYFVRQNYKVILTINGLTGWLAQYQGDRKVKSSPLYQVQYDDRYAWPLQMQIKPASVSRLIDLIPGQSELLQADFARRLTDCRGDECGWCKNQKTLKPVELQLNGKTRTVCWYVWPEVYRLDDATVEVIQQYEQMHALLAPEK